MQQIDTLVHARWVVPVEPHATVLGYHAVAVHNGRIVALLPSDRARREYQATHEHELPGHALIPGLVNTHTHAAMTLFRGLADDLPLMTWLREHIWPAEGRWVGEEFVAAGSALAVAEMLRGGTTCFNDMYFFPQITGRVASAAGMRAVIGLIVIDFPSTWAADTDGYFSRAIETFDEFKGHPLVGTAFAPHAPYSVGDAALARVRKLADELELPVHMHVHETRDEVDQQAQRYGRRPLARLDALGLVSPGLVAVHMTQLEDDEIALCADRGVQVVHCPESNLKLASGFCPVQRLRDAGINVALGTDGAASNNDLDMLGELRTAALLAKGVAQDPSAIPAATALRMATLDGARALGLGDAIGSLEPGKEADMVAVDLSFPETQPVHQPISQLVYAAGRRQVSHVWIAGRPVLLEGRLTTVDLDKIRADAEQWRERIGSQS
jgi:5-methylthioadenosine/S-adenosylhomocysteine deaminase